MATDFNEKIVSNNNSNYKSNPKTEVNEKTGTPKNSRIINNFETSQY